MKLLIQPLLFLAAGLGGFELATGRAGTASDCQGDCHVEVKCQPGGTCLVTCYDAGGKVVCEQELPCDAPCDAARCAK